MKDHTRAMMALREAFWKGSWTTEPPPTGKPYVLHGSANIGEMAAAARYLDGRSGDDEKMLLYFDERVDYELTGGEYMMNEALSIIYSPWLIAAKAAAYKAAMKYGHLQLANKLYEWHYKQAILLAIMSAPRPNPGLEKVMKLPSVVTPGMRSSTRRVLNEWVRPRILSLYVGLDPFKWLENTSGVRAYLAKDWQWPADMVKAAGAPLAPKHREILRGMIFDRRFVNPGVRFRQPLLIRFWPHGSYQAAFRHNFNGNTPPCMAVQYDKAQDRYTVHQPHGNDRKKGGPGNADIFTDSMGASVIAVEAFDKQENLIGVSTSQRPEQGNREVIL